MKISSKTVTIHASINTVGDILKDLSKGNLLVFGKPDPIFFKKYEISSSTADGITLSVRFGKFHYLGIVTPISENQCSFKLVMGAWTVIILGLLLGARGLAYSENGIWIAIVMVVGFFLLTRLVAAFWMNYLINNTITGENILFPCKKSINNCKCPKGTGNNIVKGEYIAITSFLLLCIGASIILLNGSSDPSQEKQPEDPFADLLAQEGNPQLAQDKQSDDPFDNLLTQLSADLLEEDDPQLAQYKQSDGSLSNLLAHLARDGQSDDPLAGQLIQEWYDIGTGYFFGTGIKQDYKKAADWYRKAAEKGLPAAQNDLGLMYFNGTGVQQDFRTAEFWWQKAADQGNAEAQYNMGNLYYASGAFPQNTAEALKWFTKAAYQGYAMAQFNLATMYASGSGVFQNDGVAANWCQKAAIQGQANAQLMLGIMYKRGQGVNRDYMAAYNWVEKAALQDLPAAQANLGEFYQEGVGVNIDKSKAAYWYGKAADNGIEIARERLNSLNSPYNSDFTDALEVFTGPGGISESDKKLMGNALYNLNNIGK